MIKNMIVSCVGVSFFSNILGLVIKSSSGEKIAKVLQTVTDIIVLYIIVSSLFGVGVPEFEIPEIESGKTIENAEVELRAEVALKASELLEKEVLEIIKAEFSVEALGCDAIISGEDFSLTNLNVYFDKSDFTVSGYGVKRILNEKYGIDAEVIFK